MMQDRRTTTANMRFFLGVVTAIALTGMAMAPAQAQIVLYVTGQPITAYDIEQRGKLIGLGGKPQVDALLFELLLGDHLQGEATHPPVE